MELYRILLQLSRLQSTDNKPPRYSTVLHGHIDPYRPLGTDGNPLGTDRNSMELQRILLQSTMLQSTDNKPTENRHWGKAITNFFCRVHLNHWNSKLWGYLAFVSREQKDYELGL